MKSNSLIVGAAMLGLATSTVLAHQEGHEADASQAAKPAAAPAKTPPAADASVSSRVVVRDPVTGRLRAPTDEELAALEARSATATARTPLVVRQHANGMKSAVLGPEYMSTLVVERGADGKLVTRHANPRDEHAVPAVKSAPRQAPTE